MSHPDRHFTVVAFHAHPDDESLLTGGTLALLAAAGHRVVLVTATSGERGLAPPEDGTGQRLAETRSRELQEAARALGCARVVTLGYADSGLRPDPDDRAAFANVDLEEAAARLAGVLREEHADALVGYDRHGGYGHPDHVAVHHVGTRAARLAGTPLVLEATAPGRLFRSVLRVLRLGRLTLGRPPLATRAVFADPGTITHRVPVAAALPAKRRAMQAHRSQAAGGDSPRMLDQVLRLPAPLFALAFGHEWFIEQGRAPARGRRRARADVLDSLRGRERSAQGRVSADAAP